MSELTPYQIAAKKSKEKMETAIAMQSDMKYRDPDGYRLLRYMSIHKPRLEPRKFWLEGTSPKEMIELCERLLNLGFLSIASGFDGRDVYEIGGVFGMAAFPAI